MSTGAWRKNSSLLRPQGSVAGTAVPAVACAPALQPAAACTTTVSDAAQVGKGVEAVAVQSVDAGICSNDCKRRRPDRDKRAKITSHMDNDRVM